MSFASAIVSASTGALLAPIAGQIIGSVIGGNTVA